MTNATARPRAGAAGDRRGVPDARARANVRVRAREDRIPAMPRKTEAQKAADALPRREQRFAEARRNYSDNPASVIELLNVAWCWLTAALKQRKDAGKRDSAALYKEAAESIAGFARTIMTKTADGK